MTALPPPLSGGPPAEVPLPHAPLVRVVAQVRFPTILTIRDPDRVAPLQEAIRGTYPALREDRVAQLVFTASDGPAAPAISQGLIWRFHDRDPDWRWRASLAVDYVALETRVYESRQDLLTRLHVIVSAVEKAFAPQEAQRLGVRYVDRLTGPAFGRAVEFLNPAVLGIAGSELGMAASQLLTQAVLTAEEGQILARWGQMPGQATPDPDIAPLAEPSWIIDLDMFSPSAQRFETEGLLTTATRFATRIYTVFRWMVNDEFLRHYGGQP